MPHPPSEPAPEARVDVPRVRPQGALCTCGLGMGVWLGALAALHMPHTRVRPQVWKKALGLGRDKEQARLRATQLFPAADLRHKKDHGRAEALLLAWHGWQHRGATLASCHLRLSADAERSDVAEEQLKRSS
jgi:hypothetical protein